MAFVEMKAPTFLVREKGFDPKTFTIPVNGFVPQFKIRNQIDRVFVIRLPPGDDEDGTINLVGEINIGQTNIITQF